MKYYDELPHTVYVCAVVFIKQFRMGPEPRENRRRSTVVKSSGNNVSRGGGYSGEFFFVYISNVVGMYSRRFIAKLGEFVIFLD